MLKTKNIVICATIIFFLSITNTATAAVFDAYHQKEQKVKAKSWAEQQRQVDKKLTKLEKKFAKKPNIIYILADDIGWGELGWHGGGKFRGTPSSALDAMAAQGMAFGSAYAEPNASPHE